MEFIPSTPQPSLSHELRALINQRNILTAKSKSKVLNALDKQIDENKKRQQMDLRNKVIEEIFTSEVSYLYQLEIIMKFFKEPLESSNLIATATQRTLFGNIESIYQVNGELVNQLKINGSNVAAAFLHLAPFFKMYSMYAYNYKNAISLLEDLRGNNSSVGRWIRCQESRPEVGNRLGALLIAPIQRLPRYRLLLRQLLSLTPECHPHRSTLVEAVKEVEKATSHINSQVSEQETHTRLVALQNCLLHSKPCIVGPNKKLIKEGVLMKMSANGRKAQKRYFILLSDSIVYCKLVGRVDEGPPQEPGSLQGCCLLPIGKCSVENILGQGMFNLTCHNETYILFSEHRDDATEWITAIRGAIAQYHDNLKTLRKRSSSRHTLHLTRKRKFLKENNHQSEESPMKKMKTHSPGGQEEERENQHCEERETPYICEDSSPKNNYLQSIKSLLTTFGESVRRYMFPGPSSR